MKLCPSTSFGVTDPGGSGHPTYYTPTGGASWTTVTFGNLGQDIDKIVTSTSGLPTTVNIPPNVIDVTSGETTIPAVCASDWMQINSVTADLGTGMRVLMARTLYPLGGVTGTFLNGSAMGSQYGAQFGAEWAGLPSVNMGYDCSVTGINSQDHVTTISDPASWIGAAQNPLSGGASCILQFKTRNKVMQGMTVGTSMLEGTSTLSQFNNCVAYASVIQGSTLLNQRPYGWFNAARGGAQGQSMFERAKALIPYVKPAYVLVQSHNGNEIATDGTATLLAQQQQFARLLAFLDYCEDVGIVPIVCTPIPTSAAIIGTVGSSLQWQGWTWLYTQVMALSNQGHIVLDLSTPFVGYSGGLMTAQWASGSSYTTDGQHPNDAWHKYVAQNYLIPLLNQLDTLV
jgi:hypothetical protein